MKAVNTEDVIMIQRILSFSFIACAVAFSGCSTWRCRGFVNEHEMPTEHWKSVYAVDSIEFRGVSPVMEAETNENWPRLAWLSLQDRLIGTSYIDDVGKELGLTNVVPGAVRINVSIVPIAQQRSGRSTIAWPMCASFGVFPAHLVDQVPFDIIVKFTARDVFGKAHDFATASVGLVRIDYQCGLSRLDMDAPPAALSAVGEVRDDGTIGTGRGLRPERFRGIFVKTIASAIRRAISAREHLRNGEVPQASTEFGPVPFPAPLKAERETTSGWGASPDLEPAKAETLEEFLSRAWTHPETSELKNLKKLVEGGYMTKADWKKQVEDVWNSGNDVK